MNRLVIIDGNAILHRAYHAMPPLTTSKGELVNAVFGFTSILLKIFHDFHPEYVAVCFDKKAPTFRKEKYKAYQAKRPKMVDELVGQIERVHEVVSAMNIPVFELDGFEADDVIGTLVRQAINGTVDDRKSKIGVENRKSKIEKNGLPSTVNLQPPFSMLHHPSSNLEVIVVTGDRDLLQLVDQNVKVYMPVKGLSQSRLFDTVGVLEKMGVKPSQIPDLKGLIGDQSDNYPGVSGIGPKTAVDLLTKYQTLENIYKNLQDLPLKIKERLKTGQEDAKMSYYLATILRDVPVKLDLEKCQLTDYDFGKVSALFDELEFHSMIKRLPKDIHEIEEPASADSFGEAKADQMGLF